MWSTTSCETRGVTQKEAPEEMDHMVDRLLEVTHRVQQVVTTVADRHHLTPQQVGLLRLLDEPMSMKAYAEDVSCDPSNVTGLVDRAERLGLVERVSDPLDRRVRILTLTAKGRLVRSRVNNDLATGLADALGVSTVESKQIAQLLRGMTQAGTTSGGRRSGECR
jgi:DNA-binding MarR family transcriptional regulator